MVPQHQLRLQKSEMVAAARFCWFPRRVSKDVYIPRTTVVCREELVLPAALKTHLHSKLKLTGIESRCWSSKRRQRRHACAKRIVRNAEIRAIQNIEAFRQQLQIDSFRQVELTTQTQIERSEIKSATRI